MTVGQLINILLSVPEQDMEVAIQDISGDYQKNLGVERNGMMIVIREIPEE